MNLITKFNNMYTKEQMEKCFEAGAKFGRDMFSNPSNSEYIQQIPQQEIKNLTIPVVAITSVAK